MSKKDQITKGLHEIGACWAIRNDKFIDANDDFDAKPAYHVHPDRSEPWQNAIRRFYSLDEIARYIKARKEAAAAATPEDAYEIMQDFEATLMP